jgi:hypothetical protein
MHWLRLVAATIPAAILFGCADGLRLPVPLQTAGIVSGRERCTVTPNGAPDCNAAGHALCRARGFEAGATVDTQTEYCFDKPRGAVGNCAFVTRAACH